MTLVPTTYHEWIEVEAQALKSDKCTFSRDWNVWCCLEHDWACALAKDPRDGYRLWKDGDPDYRAHAKEFRRHEADKRFWKCNREMVKANNGGWWKRRIGMLRADVRYLGVRVGAVT